MPRQGQYARCQRPFLKTDYAHWIRLGPLRKEKNLLTRFNDWEKYFNRSLLRDSSLSEENTKTAVDFTPRRFVIKYRNLLYLPYSHLSDWPFLWLGRADQRNAHLHEH